MTTMIPTLAPTTLQNFSVITKFTLNETTSTWTISGTLNSTPNQSFDVRFYPIDQVDPSNHSDGDQHGDRGHIGVLWV